MPDDPCRLPPRDHEDGELGAAGPTLLPDHGRNGQDARDQDRQQSRTLQPKGPRDRRDTRYFPPQSAFSLPPEQWPIPRGWPPDYQARPLPADPAPGSDAGQNSAEQEATAGP